MRNTFTNLQTDTQNYTRDDTAGALTFLKKELNNAQRFIFGYLQKYIDRKTQTASTVADQQFYHWPPDFGTVEQVMVTIGSVDYVLESISSLIKWRQINAITFSGSATPSFYFPRRDDFGIYPTPTTADWTITMDYHYRLADLTQDDVTGGTVTVTNDSQTVAGSSTSFTSAMIGRWFQSLDGLFYRVSAVGSTTSLTLESVYEGLTAAGETYLIGESPEIPPELHELLPYRAASLYFAGYRRDLEAAKYFENLFWTGDASMASRERRQAQGGLIGAKSRYSRVSSSSIVRRRKRLDPFRTRIFGTTIS